MPCVCRRIFDVASAESQNEGLSAFCRRRLHDLTIVHLSAVASYRAVLSPQGTNRPSCEEGQGDDGNEDDVHSSDFSYTSDEEETECRYGVEKQTLHGKNTMSNLLCFTSQSVKGHANVSLSY